MSPSKYVFSLFVVSEFFSIRNWFNLEPYFSSSSCSIQFSCLIKKMYHSKNLQTPPPSPLPRSLSFGTEDQVISHGLQDLNPPVKSFMEYILSLLVSHIEDIITSHKLMFTVNKEWRSDKTLSELEAQVTGGCAVAGYWGELVLGSGRAKVLGGGAWVVEYSSR